MRACTKCGETKPLEAFPPVRRGEEKRQTWCRDCFAAYGRDYYQRNRMAQKARLLRNTYARRGENRRFMIEYLRAHPCVDCGETDIVVLQFDHLRDKRADLSKMMSSGATWAAIEREIAKCEVRCANCHRLKTALRYLNRKRTGPVRVAKPEQLRLADAGTRTCRACGQTKPMTDFPYRSRVAATRHWICLICQREASRAWYLRRVPNARRLSGYGARAREMLAARIDEYLSAHPCVDCGESNIALLDFDHIGNKVGDVASMVRDARSWGVIADEIAKCEVRCANCHMRRTARMMGAYRIAAS
jgi:hypothetical protein